MHQIFEIGHGVVLPIAKHSRFFDELLRIECLIVVEICALGLLESDEFVGDIFNATVWEIEENGGAIDKEYF
jgi:hypothetical protein